MAGDVASQSVGMPVGAPLVWSNDTMLSSLASSWAVLEAEERPFRFRTVGDGRHSLLSRWHLHGISRPNFDSHSLYY